MAANCRKPRIHHSFLRQNTPWYRTFIIYGYCIHVNRFPHFFLFFFRYKDVITTAKNVYFSYYYSIVSSIEISSCNFSDNNPRNTSLCSLNCSSVPIIISENFASPDFLRNTKSNFLDLAEFSSLPFNNVIGFALPATTKPKVALTLPAA